MPTNVPKGFIEVPVLGRDSKLLNPAYVVSVTPNATGSTSIALAYGFGVVVTELAFEQVRTLLLEAESR